MAMVQRIRRLEDRRIATLARAEAERVLAKGIGLNLPFATVLRICTIGASFPGWPDSRLTREQATPLFMQLYQEFGIDPDKLWGDAVAA